MDKKIITEKTGNKIFINGKEIPGITDISKLPWFIKKFIDQDNNGKIDVIEKAEQQGLINADTFKNVQTPPNQSEPADPFKRPDINQNPSQNKNPILVPQDEVEKKLRLLGLILFAGVVAFIIYKYLV